MNKILTIVVPTYNAEKYLRDNLQSFCIESVLQDIEVLIVNDGSTDSSILIAKEYAEKYPQTYKIISKENGGHGSGINCGIVHAKGVYFKVVDADDWVEKDAFVHLVNELKSRKSDIVYSGFYWVYDEGQDNKEQFSRKAEIARPFKNIDYNKEYVFDEIANKIYVKMHSMTIKTEILRENNISIDEHCFYVDAEYITYPIPFVQTISFIDDYVYMYRIGRQGQSVSLEKMQKNIKNYDKVLDSLLKFYLHLGSEINCTREKKDYIAGIIARIVAGKMKIMLSFPGSIKQKKEIVQYDNDLKRICPDIYYKNKNKAVSILRKTNFSCYYLASIMVKKIYK